MYKIFISASNAILLQEQAMRVWALHAGNQAVFLFNRHELLNRSEIIVNSIISIGKNAEEPFANQVKVLQKELGFHDLDYWSLPNPDLFALEKMKLSSSTLDFLESKLCKVLQRDH